MNFDELELCFDLGEDDLVLGFTPEAIRATCSTDRRALYLLSDKLWARGCSSLDDATVAFRRVVTAGLRVGLVVIRWYRGGGHLDVEIFP